MSVNQAAQWLTGLLNIGHRTLPSVSCTERTTQGNDFELIQTVKIKNGHSVEGSFGSEFLAICNHCVVMAA